MYVKLTQLAGDKSGRRPPPRRNGSTTSSSSAGSSISARSPPYTLQTALDLRMREYTDLAMAGDVTEARGACATVSIRCARRSARRGRPASRYAHQKYWQELLGQVGGPVRRPLLELSEAEKAATRAAFETCGLHLDRSAARRRRRIAAKLRKDPTCCNIRAHRRLQFPALDRREPALPQAAGRQQADVRTKTDMTVMIVGGPNQRVDFHDDPVEEFFYQLKGDMLAQDRRERQDLRRADQAKATCSCCRPHTRHSPQRPIPGSVGLVVEGTRRDTDIDGFEWYCFNCGERVHRVEVQVEGHRRRTCRRCSPRSTRSAGAHLPALRRRASRQGAAARMGGDGCDRGGVTHGDWRDRPNAGSDRRRRADRACARCRPWAAGRCRHAGREE